MKIYFDDPEYDGQFLRTLDYVPLGAQIGEAWAIVAQIRAGDAASWYNAWSFYADRLYGLAVKSQAAGHRVSARNAFLRASNYYRAAYIFMFALPIDPRVIEAYEKQTDSFQKALRYSSSRSRFLRFRTGIQLCPVISSNPMRVTRRAKFCCVRVVTTVRVKNYFSA
jgi:hypothetical protein